MKRELVVLIVMLAVTFSVIASGGKAVKGKVEALTEREVLEYRTILPIPEGWGGGAGVIHPTLHDKEILKRFGIKFNHEDILASEVVMKLNLLFATSGEEPDVILDNIGGVDLMRWGNEGYLVPLSDYLDKLPNYMKLRDENSWNFVYTATKSIDGKLYWLPSYTDLLSGCSWIYRKGTFDKMGLSFPKTTDELYTTLKKIKAADPDSVPYPSRSGTGWFLSGFLLAYRTCDSWLIDPDTGMLVYGPSTNKFRDALKYVNKLYREKLVEQEFPTATTAQWTEKYAQGKTYIQYSYYNRAQWAMDVMKDVDPDAGWTWSKDNVIAYPGKQQLVSRSTPSYYARGPAISRRCDQEKIYRLLEYFDWACTEEGQIFESFGVEGVTFEYKDGKPVYMDHMYTLNTREGEDMVLYGFCASPSAGFLVRRWDRIVEHWGEDGYELTKALKDKPCVKKDFAWELTGDQEKELADLETVIKDIWLEYATKFIMGKMDPANNDHWNEYLTTLKKGGFDRAKEIREEALKKSIVY